MTTDPPRLLDSESEAPEGLRNLLRGAKQELPSEARLSRIAAGLGPILGPGLGGDIVAQAAGQGSGVASSGAAVSAGGVWVKVMLGVLAAGGAGAVVWSALPPEPEPRVILPHEAPNTVVASEVETPKQPEAKSEEVTQPAQTPSPAKKAAKRSSEAQLLGAARAALKSDPSRALAFTQEHQRLYPKGQLAQEREVIAIAALRKLGKGKNAADRAKTFEEQYPGSAHQPRVDSKK